MTKRALCIALLAAGCAAAPWSDASAHKYKFRTLYSFCEQANCPDGRGPQNGVAMDASGNLYGTTFAGGNGVGSESIGSGTVFRLSRKGRGWKFKTLYSFCSKPDCTDGSNSKATLVIDTSGNLYGTTYQGGTSQSGVAFELLPNSTANKWKYKKIYDFCSHPNCKDGAGPNGGLTYQGASSGLPYDGVSPLYGNTEDGGNVDEGVVYQLTRQERGWGETALHRFCSDTNCEDGATPVAAPVADADGRLFGVTVSGGNSSNKGVVYSVAGANESVTYAFCPLSGCLDGQEPGAPLTLDSKGHIFGTTVFGGTTSNAGTIFEILGADEEVLYNFCSQPNCTDGSQPSSALVEDANGRFFGSTLQGGDHNQGVVYQLSRGAEQVLYSFCSQASCADGQGPSGNLVIDSSGNLYGTTLTGGAFGKGTVFELEF